MKIPRPLVKEMVAHAREEAPNECCGMLGGQRGQVTRLYRARNSEQSPLRYDLDSKDLIRIHNEMNERGEELVGIYHSHTASPAHPSQTDVNLAAYPDAVYVIVSLEDAAQPEVRGYWIRDGKIDESELDIG